MHKDGKRKQSWILYSALVLFISMLIGWVASEFAKELEGSSIEISAMSQTVIVPGRARLIAIPVWLAISLGGALAVHHYSKKPAIYMRLLNIILILLAVYIVVALFFTVFSSN